jgi:hypothetical protein
MIDDSQGRSSNTKTWKNRQVPISRITPKYAWLSMKTTIIE